MKHQQLGGHGSDRARDPGGRARALIYRHIVQRRNNQRRKRQELANSRLVAVSLIFAVGYAVLWTLMKFLTAK